MEGRKGVREVEVEGSTQPGPTFSLVYATSLLQHHTQVGLNPPAMGGHTPQKGCIAAIDHLSIC